MMTGADPDTVDHLNGCKIDNRWVNLRDVTSLINCRNVRATKSGIRGVYHHAQSGGWLAQINAEGRVLSFYSKHRADVVAWRREMEIKHGYIVRAA